jgi:hypothetical protein
MVDVPSSFNLSVAWIGIFLGLVSGSFLGLFFQREEWLEGYSSWQRRLLRLGHISFFGIAFLNLAFVFSLSRLKFDQIDNLWIPAICFALAEFTMPSICFASAFWKPARVLFPIPVICLLVGTLSFVSQGVF